jgi:hypothetical protein
MTCRATLSTAPSDCIYSLTPHALTPRSPPLLGTLVAHRLKCLQVPPSQKVLRRNSLGGGANMAVVMVATQVSPEMIDLPSLTGPVKRAVPLNGRVLYLSRGKQHIPLPELEMLSDFYLHSHSESRTWSSQIFLTCSSAVLLPRPFLSTWVTRTYGPPRRRSLQYRGISLIRNT